MEMTAKPSPKLHYAYSATLFLAGLLPGRAPLCFKSQYKITNHGLKQVKTDDISEPVLTHRNKVLVAN